MTLDDNTPAISDDEFDLAFGEAVGDPKPDKAELNSELEPEKDPEPAKAEADPEPEKVEEPVEAKTDPEPEPKKDPEPDPLDEIRKQNADLQKQIKEMSKAPAAPAPVKQEKPEPKKEEVSDEDKAALETLNKDWAEVARALEVQNRQLLAKVEALVNEKLAAVEQKFEPMAKSVQAQAQTSFQAEVMKSHADALTLLPEVEKWIETQSPVKKSLYNTVLDQGSVADVVELYDLYKEATGLNKPEPKKEDPPVDLEKERRLRAMEEVKKTETKAKDSKDPEDFDGAFAEAAKMALR